MGHTKLTMQYSYGGQICQNTFHYWFANFSPAISNVNALMAEFIEQIVPVFRAVMSDEATLETLTGFAPNIGFSQVTTINLPGLVDAPAGELIPADLALICNRGVGATVDNETGGGYTGNRPIRRGRFYLSGLPKVIMDITGVNTAATTTSAWNAFRAAQTANLLASDGATWIPVVVGLPLEAKPATPTSPTPKPARPYVVAPITSITLVDFTDLTTRNPS